MGRENFVGARGARAGLLSGLACAVVTLAAAEARADGDQLHALKLQQHGVGLSAATFGVGLSGGRVAGQPATPVTTAAIAVSGIPVGATIEHAYLYWVTYGVAGNAGIKLDGTTLTGSLAGQSAGTCWKQFPTFKNFVYRADVTAMVDGNGSYVLTGFPSGAETADTQGASLFIVYTDPSDGVMGSVTLFDGAITIDNIDGGSTTTFTNVQVPSTILSATFMVGVGDGEVSLADGALRFNNGNVKVPADGTHYRSSAGLYWDARSYDVKQMLKPGNKTVEWDQSFTQDCLVFAFSALAFRASVVDADADHVDDALDNCPGVTNADQADTDGDGPGDLCDNCPLHKNDTQPDKDEDGTGNICDTCPYLSNPGNLDSDGDGFGDACDNCDSVANPSQALADACAPQSNGGAGSGGQSSGSAGEPSSQGGETLGNSGAPSSSGGEDSVSSGNAGSPGKGGTKASGGPTTAGGAASSDGGAGDGTGDASAHDDGGCGCAIPSSSGAGKGLVAAAALALSSLLRRRRASLLRVFERLL